MVGNLHAIALIVLVAATLAASVKYHKERPPRRLLPSLMASALMGFLASAVTSHLCHAGQPLTQWIIPAVCLAATLTYVGDAALRWGAAIVTVVAMFGLSFHYSDIVHGPTYVGNPLYGKMRDERLAREERWARDLVGKLGVEDDRLYPPGWLSKASFVTENPKHFEDLVETTIRWERIEVHPLWHSWLTRLYQRETTPVELWYPGGTLLDAAPGIEFRERGPSAEIGP